jgi:hypothetical protein
MGNRQYTILFIEKSNGRDYTFFIVSDRKDPPKKKSVVYFCVYRDGNAGLKNISNVVKWGGTDGYFNWLMNDKDTPQILVEKIRSKRIII